MHWLSRIFKAKATDMETSREVTDPAREQISITQDRLSRIDRILKESREAELVVRRVNTPKRY